MSKPRQHREDQPLLKVLKPPRKMKRPLLFERHHLFLLKKTHVTHFDNDVDPFSNHHESDTHLPGWSGGNEATVEENGAAAGRLSDDHRDALTGSAS